MPRNKSANLNLRIDPSLKEAVKEAAALEHRSIANFIEILIRAHCKRRGIRISRQEGIFDHEEID